MKKMLLIVIATIGLWIGCCVNKAEKIYGEMNMENTLQSIQIENVNTEENRKLIAKGVLEDTGRSDLYDLNDLESVEVYFGNITPDDEEDIVVTVSFGPSNTVVAGYTKTNDEYMYVGDVGNFYEVKNVSFVPIETLNQDAIIITEFANQNVGAYETSEFLEGFIFDEGKFNRVLKTPTFIEAAWNEIWEDSENGDPDAWNKVTQTTDDKWRNKNEIVLNLVRYQQYFTSNLDNNDTSTIPKTDSFEKQNQRIITEQFEWSDEWQLFILDEAVENSTGQKVAIIENRDASPYALAGYTENAYTIQRKDNTLDTIKASELTF